MNAERPPGLNKRSLDPDPFKQFERWYGDNLAAQPNVPEAVTLATADKAGAPSARTVLMKGYDTRGFVFYTNYQSRKGWELNQNPTAVMLFYWRESERQIRISGLVSRISRPESEAYFDSRPRGSQLAAHVSRQSQVIPNRKVLEDQFQALTREYEGRPVPLPSYWGGYRLFPLEIEFWQGRADRLHDRLVYRRQPEHGWIVERLSP